MCFIDDCFVRGRRISTCTLSSWTIFHPFLSTPHKQQPCERSTDYQAQARAWQTMTLCCYGNAIVDAQQAVSDNTWSCVNRNVTNVTQEKKSVKNIKLFSLAIQAAQFMILQNVRNYVTTPPLPLHLNRRLFENLWSGLSQRSNEWNLQKLSEILQS